MHNSFGVLPPGGTESCFFFLLSLTSVRPLRQSPGLPLLFLAGQIAVLRGGLLSVLWDVVMNVRLRGRTLNESRDFIYFSCACISR